MAEKFGWLAKMRGFMPQDFFDIGAVTIAQLHLTTNNPILEIAPGLANEYRGSYQDDGFEQDWIEAADQIVLLFKDLFSKESDKAIAASLRQMQFCIKNFNLDGRKKKKRLFNGTLFVKEKKKNPERVSKCIENLLCYHMRTISGNIPMAPPNWSL